MWRSQNAQNVDNFPATGRIGRVSLRLCFTLPEQVPKVFPDFSEGCQPAAAAGDAARPFPSDIRNDNFREPEEGVLYTHKEMIFMALS
jgi:hypothetical protein